MRSSTNTNYNASNELLQIEFAFVVHWYAFQKTNSVALIEAQYGILHVYL